MPRKTRLPLELDEERDDFDEVEGSVEEIEDETAEVEDTEDGGAIVRFGDEDDAQYDDGDWWDNLATDEHETELVAIASKLIDLADRDREARKRRDEQYEEGLKRTGLANDAPGGAAFEGAAKVVHPMLIETAIDFAARAIKELFPPTGPVKDHIEGSITEQKVAKASRKTKLMNWQLTRQCREFRAELEQLLTQVPMGGTQYLKLGWDELRNRPEALFVGVDEMLVPFAATNFYSAQRRTHVEMITEQTYRQRVREGRYRDTDLPSPGMPDEVSATAKQSDKIEGRDMSSYNEDGLRAVYNVYVTFDLSDGIDPKVDQAAPYIIAVDRSSSRVLSIYRNWEPEDETLTELQHFTEWPFIPWRGAYALGLPHIIGGLSGASTGALRALLDSAHINNTPSGLKLKGTKVGSQTTRPQPGEIAEIEGGYVTDDIRKLAMPFPYNPPSPVLFSLLGFLVDAGKGVVRTALDDVADMRSDAPVGTTMARIEQGLMVYSAVFGRLHDAMGRTLDILHRLNATYLDDEALEKEVGEEIATRADFNGPADISPVSDPYIFSETQRLAQVQTVVQRSDAHPELYDQRKVEERVLETLKVPEAKSLLKPAPEPKEQNAANENTAASLGRPVMAFPMQDHLAHLQSHLAYMRSPVFGANPLIAPSFLPAILGHIREHIALWYSSAIFDLASEVLGIDAGDFLKEIKGDDGLRRQLDQMIAEATILVLTEGEQVLGGLPEIIQQAQAMLQQMQPPQMQDPRLALEGQKLQQQAAKDQQDAQLKAQEMQQDAQLKAQESQDRLAALGLQIKGRMAERQIAEEGDTLRTREKIAADILRNREDNDTATRLATFEALSAERTQLINGNGINPNPMDQ